MNICPRLDQLYQRETEANKVRLKQEIEMLLHAHSLPASFMQHLHILDEKPWEDFRQAGGEEFREAGLDILRKLQHAASSCHLSQLNDLSTQECLNRIEDYVRNPEDFACRVKHLMLKLNELIDNWQSYVEQPNEYTVKEQIKKIQLLSDKIQLNDNEMNRKREEFDRKESTIQWLSAEQVAQIELHEKMTMEQFCQRRHSEHSRSMEEFKESRKLLEQRRQYHVDSLRQVLDKKADDIIAEINAYKLAVKKQRVHHLKPTMPPIEDLNDINIRCCELFEELDQLECLTPDDDHNVIMAKLFKSVIVVEQQPPPVLKLEGKSDNVRVRATEAAGKTSRRKSKRDQEQENKHESKYFSITVRILGAASCPRLQVAASQLKFTVHSQRELEQALQPGPVPSHISYCDIKEEVRKPEGNVMDARSNFRRTFDKLKLLQVPKPEVGLQRNEDGNVTDKKCAIVISADLANFALLPVIKVLCEPMVLTTATVQTCPALGTIFWDAAFSKLDRSSYDEEDEVTWQDLAREIRGLFNEYIPLRPLTDEHMNNIARRLHQIISNDDASEIADFGNNLISRKCFMKTPKVDSSFWRWLFSCLNLIRSDPHDKHWLGLKQYWEDGLIMGFVTKQAAEQLINLQDAGTFLIRFRDTGIEKSNRDCPRASLSIVYKHPVERQAIHACDKLKAVNLQEQGLGNCLQQFTVGDGIKRLYPTGQSFEDAFSCHINDEKTEYGYVKLVQVLVLSDRRSPELTEGMDVAEGDTEIYSRSNSTMSGGHMSQCPTSPYGVSLPSPSAVQSPLAVPCSPRAVESPPSVADLRVASPPSVAYLSVASPQGILSNGQLNVASPHMNVASPLMSLASPQINVTSPHISVPRVESPSSATSPAYSQPSPAYSQPSPAYSQPSPAYSQPSPAYSQPSPAYHNNVSQTDARQVGQVNGLGADYNENLDMWSVSHTQFVDQVIGAQQVLNSPGLADLLDIPIDQLYTG